MAVESGIMAPTRITRSPLSVTMPGNTGLPIRPERGGITASASPESRVNRVSGLSAATPGPPWSSRYCSTGVRACRLRSAGIDWPFRCGSRRSPKNTIIAIVPASSGTPTMPNSKNPKAPPADFAAMSDTSTLTGVPVSASMEPACDEKTNGIRS